MRRYLLVNLDILSFFSHIAQQLVDFVPLVLENLQPHRTRRKAKRHTIAASRPQSFRKRRIKTLQVGRCQVDLGTWLQISRNNDSDPSQLRPKTQRHTKNAQLPKCWPMLAVIKIH